MRFVLSALLTFEGTIVAGGRHRRHANPFSVRHAIPPLDEVAVYGRKAPLALDIGCGLGGYVGALAASRREYNVLGLEIRPHLVQQANAAFADAALQNAHLVYANANSHLDTLVADDSVAWVSINFPDPWFKLRHRKRRVVEPHLLRVLAKKLAAGGRVYAMTDVPMLAEGMRTAFARAGFVDLHRAGDWPLQSDTGIASEREIWHQSKHDPVWRMAFAPPQPSAAGLQST